VSALAQERNELNGVSMMPDVGEQWLAARDLARARNDAR
jgi:hypothetical protein